MASQKNFAITPSVSISRSKFRRPSQHKTSFNLGDIVPIYVDADILPGDTVSLDLASLVRMSTPIAPIMDNIHIDYYAFFVPNRILWDKWKEFMGENDSSAGAVASAPDYPVAFINSSSGITRVTTGSIGDYMGLPVDLAPASSASDPNAVLVSRMPGMAYLKIYSEWFRDQNLIAPIRINSSHNGVQTLGSQGSTYFSYGSPLFKAAKDSDYFTRALPFAQKGAPVSLPLGSTAPLVKVGTGELWSVKNETTGAITFAAGDALQVSGSSTVAAGATGSIGVRANGSNVNNSVSLNVANYAADLSNATAATINQLRFAFQYQKFLEKDALYGTRYWEILKGHFGITAPDASLQRPELLGHFRQNINIDQVLQTSATDSDGTALGTPGANSVSGKSGHLISKSFVEHGVLMILAVARHDQTYAQGINRMWSRKSRTDFYFPVFANLGAQEIKNKEIFAVGNNSSQNEGTFGFQEAWAEYRYKPSIATGLLNPNASNSLGYWTLTNRFSSLPTLSKSFIEQDRTALNDALVTGSTGPDFIADFYFDAVYVRPMPMYSIPGLIDHH